MPILHQELNKEIVDDLLEVLGEGYFDIMEEQVRQANAYMLELDSAIAAGRVETVRNAAHCLKSSAGQVGMQGIYAAAKNLEYQARDDADHKGIMSDDTRRLFEELQASYKAATKALRDYVNERYKALQN